MNLIPEIQEPWWTIAGDPDLGDYTTPTQQPVDFALWQAADGTWQLWSCIRGTACGGRTRLFHRWESPSLEQPDWQPMGIAMEADPALGETPGGLQAPHVLLHEGAYHMFYGDWESICLATSVDGKCFSRRVLPNGRTGMFTEGDGANTRDPMVILTNGLWHCYYTAFPGGQGAVYCRTSPDLVNWSRSKMVAFGGSAGTGPCSSECPFVLELSPGCYYLLRTQRYGRDAQTSVYCSQDPLNFGVEDDSSLIRTLPIAAPELVCHEGSYCVASLLPSLKGIRLARLRWIAAG